MDILKTLIEQLEANKKSSNKKWHIEYNLISDDYIRLLNDIRKDKMKKERIT